MADAAVKSDFLPGWVHKITALRGFIVPVSFIALVGVLLVPLPPALLDVLISLNFALAVIILLTTIYMEKPLDFSVFPSLLLATTLYRLVLNVASTRLILSADANSPEEALHIAGHVILAFGQFVAGDSMFVGIVIFLILIIVQFIVITKGATRISEVAARFTLDAMPGKQMAIDADLNAGTIDEKEARRRRQEISQEADFFGAMDGASKFVRGDAIAGIIITAINIAGGFAIGMLERGWEVGQTAKTFTLLTIGDGLTAQIPALIISLAAGLVVAKGGTRGSVEMAVMGQLSNHPKALLVTAAMMAMLAVFPGLPFLPFAVLASAAGLTAYLITKRRGDAEVLAVTRARESEKRTELEAQRSIKVELRVKDIEIVFGQQLSSILLRKHDELAQRVEKLRRKFARQYGFVVPEIQLSDDFSLSPRSYQIRLQGVSIAGFELPLGEALVIIGDGPRPSVSGTETKEPAFGLRALWVPDAYAATLKREGFTPVDPLTILLTHLSEAIRGNLAQLFSYRDLQNIIEALSIEYKRLLDEIRPAHISNSGMQAVLKLLLAERVSIRNMHAILEAIAEVVPHTRRAEQISEHVRQRLSQQICGDLIEGGALGVLRLGARWDLAFHESLRRDPRGEVMEFDIDPQTIEEFSRDASRIIQPFMDKGEAFVLVSSVEARPFVRMVVERLFPTLPVLSHAE